ncbi:MAG TPA: heparan-alpha-glucosaminide N-acetyltransferase domain-containing protein, partial [Candidatus Atribacteria bacterium]|nr:heparan-alpha-glucosaminide N-acetyltransferase domain-containing protein [Candidatus Atribacteria bacterium]
PVQVVSFLGRHSLTIYLLHQPIIIVVLYLLGIISFPV